MMTILLTLAANAAEVQSVRVEAGRPSYGEIVGIVDAPARDVAAVITDCAGTSTWFPDLYDSHLVATFAGGYRCAGRTDLPWPLTDRTWEIDVTTQKTGDGYVSSFAYVAGSGNLVAMSGAYHLTPTADGRTTVAYDAAIDLGFWIPEVLVNWATRRVLPGVIHGLESQAGATQLVAAAE